MATIIQNGTLVSGEGTARRDLLMENGTIAGIGGPFPTEGRQVVDATGCLVFPGFIDAHTHLDMDNGVIVTADDFTSGSRAALAGGTTTILDFATQTRGRSLKEGLEQWHAKAWWKSFCDYGFHMAVTDWNERTREEIFQMAKEGVTSFKVYMAYDNLRLSDGEIYALMKAVQEIGGIVSCHCENGDLVSALIQERRQAGELSPKYHPLSRPDYLEAEAVERFCAIAKAAGTPAYIVHLSSAAGLEAARRARRRGQQVILETCPQYLVLDDSLYELPGFESAKYVCSPPLRKEGDQDALWDALAAGEIDTIATDHCSFWMKGQKELGREDFSKIPNGMPGLRYRPSLVYGMGVASGHLTASQMAVALAENPARLFGMYPQKGALLLGSDADVVIWDPDKAQRITAEEMEPRMDYTPFEGMEFKGAPREVFLRGHLAFQKGKEMEATIGRYIARGRASYPGEGGNPQGVAG